MEAVLVFQAPQSWGPTSPPTAMKLAKITNREHSVKLGIDDYLLFMIAYLSSNTHCNTRGEVYGVLHLPKHLELIAQKEKATFD